MLLHNFGGVKELYINVNIFDKMQEGDMGIYLYVKLIHFVIKQKLTHHCKAIILQKRCLKKFFKRLGKESCSNLN